MAVAFDASGTLAATSGAGPFSFNITVGGSANLLLVWYGCLDGGSRTATGVTAGGVAMTRHVAADADEGLAGVEVWYLVNPPTGSVTIQISVSESISRCSAIACSYTGVDTAAPIEAANVKTSGADVSPTSISLSGSTTDSLIVNAGYWRDYTSISADAGQSNVVTVLSTDDMGVGHEAGGEATETATWTLTGTVFNACQSIISLKAGAGGGATGNPWYYYAQQ